jgi:hypothetical protein
MNLRTFAYWSGTLTFVALLSVSLPTHGSETGSCPVTLPKHWPTRPAPSNSSAFGWYGSSNLAAFLPLDGVWYGMGRERNYGDKF